MLIATDACPRCGGAMELTDDYDQGVRRGQQWSCINCSYSLSAARLNRIRKEKDNMIDTNNEESRAPEYTRPDMTGITSKAKVGQLLQQWYGEHKDEILSDIERTNRNITREKWGMTWNALYKFLETYDPPLIKRALIKNDTESISPPPPEPGPSSPGLVIRSVMFPPFNENWTSEVKVQWLDCYKDMYLAAMNKKRG